MKKIVVNVLVTFFLLFSVFAGERTLESYPSFVQKFVFGHVPNRGVFFTGTLSYVTKDNDSYTCRYCVHSNYGQIKCRYYFDRDGDLYKYVWYDNDGKLIKWTDRYGIEKGEKVYQNGKLIYEKYSDGNEHWYDYDDNGNVVLGRHKNKNDKEYYIDENEYDEKNRCIWSFTHTVDENENETGWISESLTYDENNFVTSVLWYAPVESDWTCTINGYKFTGIRGEMEYRFEKISDTQIKVFPKDKHWFIVEIKK